MNLKEYLKECAQSFFIVVTLINVAMVILGRVFYPAQQLGYEAFGYPLLYGICSMVPVLILYSAKELTIRQLLIRKLIQMLLITVLLVLCICGAEGIRIENAANIAVISATVIAVYVLEEILSWLVNSRDAQRLTESLHKYQETQR